MGIIPRIKRLLGIGHVESAVFELRADLLVKLNSMERKIMSAISEFAVRQNQFNDRIDNAVTSIQGDVKFLSDKITEMQNSPGPISPEDQASLDALQARSAALADKIEALDALTPPAPPSA